MDAKYLLRLDDACPHMHHEKWNKIEEIFDIFNIKPIVAIIPDNKDKSLNIKEKDPHFWEKALNWKNKGWTIGLHGYQHNMRPTNAKQILPIYKRSEFSGLSYEEQSFKIKRGYNILNKNGLNPTVWVAPAHCFDKTTLEVINNETSIRIVSDGIAFNTYFDFGMNWIPQQLWDFEPKRNGIWTVCLHPNMMNIEDIEKLKEKISLYKDRIISVDDLVFKKNRKSLKSLIFSLYFWRKFRILRYLTNILKG
tara:strand:+ start:9410 stop:10162 length:753 start_codon:yes stop_codon:yes gene_type:complete